MIVPKGGQFNSTVPYKINSKVIMFHDIAVIIVFPSFLW